MTHEHTSEGMHVEANSQQKADPLGTATRPPIDELVAGMIRTLEDIQRDPILHHQLSQRGF